MEVVGFAEITKDAEIFGALSPQDFQGKVCRVMEFDSEGGALILNSNNSALGMVNKESIKSSFKCTIVNNLYIVPPTLDYLGRSQYVAMCVSRKGGYTQILRDMIIRNSILKGEFNDDFIWKN